MKKILFTLLMFFFTQILFAQKITYSQPDNDDNRDMQYEIIGKMNGNYLVYKASSNTHYISTFNAEMQQIEKVKLDYITDRVFNVDFLQYQDFACLFDQYQKKNIIYCMAVKLDAMGKKIGEPMQLDTTNSREVQDNKIYSFVQSADKQKIMFYKINSRNEKIHYITTLLYNKNLTLINKATEPVQMKERNSFLTAFELDNKGNFLFFKATGTVNNDNIVQLTLINKQADSTTFKYINLKKIENIFLDEIKMKADNVSNKFIITSFYGNKRRGDIQGLYISIFDANTNTESVATTTVFDNNFREDAKGDAGIKQAFNDYFIKQIIPKKNGGFLLSAECEYSSNKTGDNLNRYDYLNQGSSFNNGGFYNVGSAGYPWGRNYGSYNITKYYADNIAVASFDSTGKIEWNNVIRKAQYNDNSDIFIGYGMFNAGNQLKFLYNTLEKQQWILYEQSLNPDGQIIRSSTLKSLDKGYDFMPRNAKQVAAKQIIVPCMYRSFLCFAKIDY
jgi:hypothetical protein